VKYIIGHSKNKCKNTSTPGPPAFTGLRFDIITTTKE